VKSRTPKSSVLEQRHGLPTGILTSACHRAGHPLRRFLRDRAKPSLKVREHGFRGLGVALPAMAAVAVNPVACRCNRRRGSHQHNARLADADGRPRLNQRNVGITPRASKAAAQRSRPDDGDRSRVDAELASIRPDAYSLTRARHDAELAELVGARDLLARDQL